MTQEEKDQVIKILEENIILCDQSINLLKSLKNYPTENILNHIKINEKQKELINREILKLKAQD